MIVAQKLHDESEAGARTHITLVAWWHQPSIRAFSRVGMTVIGSIGRWNVGPWRSCFATGAVRLGPPSSFSVDV